MTAESGGRRLYRYTLTTTTTPPLGWAASDERHSNVSIIVRGKEIKTVCINYFQRERRAEAESNRGLSAYQPNALSLGQTGSQDFAPSSHRTPHPHVFVFAPLFHHNVVNRTLACDVTKLVCRVMFCFGLYDTLTVVYSPKQSAMFIELSRQTVYFHL